jgi:signal transduction histidine kinase
MAYFTLISVFIAYFVYVDYPDFNSYVLRDVNILLILVFVVAFTTSVFNAIVINVLIIVFYLSLAFIVRDSFFFSMLPNIILFIAGIGSFCIAFNKLLKNFIKRAIESRNKIQELSDYKQNIMRLIIHDLKVPVSSILNLSDKQENSKMRKINFQINNLKIQLDNVLDIERLEEPEIKLNFQEVQISKIMKSAIQAVEVIALKKHTIINTRYKTDGILKCDSDLIERVIVNLLTNAIKYSSVNTQVIITVFHVNGSCKINIKDQGMGICSEHLSYIFDKFYMIKSGESRGDSSTGLGLSFCKLAIDAHQGTINVKSEIAKGSEFEISIPGFKHLINKKESCEAFSQNIAFTATEKNMIKQVCDEIKDIPIYRVSDIIKLIDTLVDYNSMNVLIWKENLTDIIYTGNQDNLSKTITPFL